MGKGKGYNHARAVNTVLVFKRNYTTQYAVRVTLLAGQRTCDSQVAGSSPDWAPLRSGLGQAIYICLPLSPSSIIWYRPRRVISGWESNRGSGGQ